ncbi:ABC transporter ATP-binding protein [Nocardioides pantholopis]|uniref:ABC transporter ATP-binding protein n=1 Tax=Nocardioides pantholopis TaxID=2483798 RepID=UPI000F0770E6|nr:ATP-binding cassette domain-containing protein [Nocardioides pantholopis]
MLSARDVWVRYGRRSPWVLEGVDLDLAPGEVLGLHAPSGRGKSTLAAALAGLRRPDRGEVTADGVPVGAGRGPRPVQLVGQHADRAVNPRWRIREVLAEARPDGPERAVAEQGLVDEGWLERYPHEISGGELQRVNLARALLVEPRYLLADEISSSLDALTQAVLWRHVRAYVDRTGAGVLAISHDAPLLDQVADRVVTR